MGIFETGSKKVHRYTLEFKIQALKLATQPEIQTQSSNAWHMPSKVSTKSDEDHGTEAQRRTTVPRRPAAEQHVERMKRDSRSVNEWKGRNAMKNVNAPTVFAVIVLLLGGMHAGAS